MPTRRTVRSVTNRKKGVQNVYWNPADYPGIRSVFSGDDWYDPAGVRSMVQNYDPTQYQTPAKTPAAQPAQPAQPVQPFQPFGQAPAATEDYWNPKYDPYAWKWEFDRQTGQWSLNTGQYTKEQLDAMNAAVGSEWTSSYSPEYYANAWKPPKDDILIGLPNGKTLRGRYTSTRLRNLLKKIEDGKENQGEEETPQLVKHVMQGGQLVNWRR